MRLPYFQYHSPRSLKAAFMLLKKIDGKGLIMAGGTELLNRMKFRLIEPEHIISLSIIKNLGNISIRENQEIEIGTMAKLTDIAHFFEEIKPYKALHEAAYQVASMQIRNMATIGGNIFQDTRCMFYNRSRDWQRVVPPCHKRGGNICHAIKNSKRCLAVYQGDMAPILIALKAKAVFYTPDVFYEMPVEEVFSGNSREPFITGDKKILTSINLAPPERNLFSTYRKYRIRDGVDFPLAGIAVALHKDGDTVANLRLCLTGVAPQPVIVRDVENIANGTKLTEKIIKEIAEMAYNAAHPVANLEDTPDNRRFMVRQIAYDLLMEAIHVSR
ncbi:MAG: FAD binding domain-containing protein [Syntrophorhabdaceae bacterium]|nr:FAD binding domain-containing protein [Syntrophorhabdaceae bacterium]